MHKPKAVILLMVASNLLWLILWVTLSEMQLASATLLTALFGGLIVVSSGVAIAAFVALTGSEARK